MSHSSSVPLSRRRRARRGVALLITLVVMILYLIIAHHYIYTTTVYARIAVNSRDEVTAYWLARGGIFRGRAQLKLDDEFVYDSVGETWAGVVGYEEGDAPDGAEVDVRVSDEASKFNIFALLYDPPSASQQNTENPLTEEKIQEILVRLIKICQRRDDRLVVGEVGDEEQVYDLSSNDDVDAGDVVKGILEYLEDEEYDQGDSATFDAEDISLSSPKKQSPYKLLTINELLNAQDMTRELLFGPTQGIARVEEDDDEDTPYYQQDNFEVDPLTEKELSTTDKKQIGLGAVRAGEALETSRSVDPLPLADYLTLWGDGKININTAPLEVLLAMSEHMTFAMAEQIIRARDEAYAREYLVETEEIDTGGSASSSFDEEEEESDDDEYAFRDEDIASAEAFYARAKLDPSTGEDVEIDSTLEEPEEVWAAAFEDMQPFLTTRSRYYRVRSTATVDKITKTFTAIFRRDAAPVDASASDSDTTDAELPPAPSVRMTLVFLDEE